MKRQYVNATITSGSYTYLGKDHEGNDVYLDESSGMEFNTLPPGDETATSSAAPGNKTWQDYAVSPGVNPYPVLDKSVANTNPVLASVQQYSRPNNVAPNANVYTPTSGLALPVSNATPVGGNTNSNDLPSALYQSAIAAPGGSVVVWQSNKQGKMAAQFLRGRRQNDDPNVIAEAKGLNNATGSTPPSAPGSPDDHAGKVHVIEYDENGNIVADYYRDKTVFDDPGLYLVLKTRGKKKNNETNSWPVNSSPAVEYPNRNDNDHGPSAPEVYQYEKSEDDTVDDFVKNYLKDRRKEIENGIPTDDCIKVRFVINTASGRSSEDIPVSKERIVWLRRAKNCKKTWTVDVYVNGLLPNGGFTAGGGTVQTRTTSESETLFEIPPKFPQSLVQPIPLISPLYFPIDPPQPRLLDDGEELQDMFYPANQAFPTPSKELKELARKIIHNFRNSDRLLRSITLTAEWPQWFPDDTVVFNGHIYEQYDPNTNERTDNPNDPMRLTVFNNNTIRTNLLRQLEAIAAIIKEAFPFVAIFVHFIKTSGDAQIRIRLRAIRRSKLGKRKQERIKVKRGNAYADRKLKDRRRYKNGD